MEEYGKTLKISYKSDSESLNQVKNDLKELEEESGFASPIKRRTENQKSFLADFARETETLGKFMKPEGMSIGAFIEKKIISGLAGIFDKFVNETKDIFTSAWEELGTMLDYSKLSSAGTRNLAFSYGFSPSESYAYEKTLEIMGLSGMEDLMYLNTQEQQKFNELFTKYSDRYTDLYDSGFFEDLQEYEYEKQTYRDEYEQVAMSIIIENKDLIFTFLKAGIEAMKIIAKPVEWISQILDPFDSGTESERIAALNEAYANRTTNIEQYNSYNITGPDAQTIAESVARSPVEALIAGIEGSMQ